MTAVVLTFLAAAIGVFIPRLVVVWLNRPLRYGRIPMPTHCFEADNEPYLR